MGLSEDTNKRVLRSSALSMGLSVLIVSACFLGALIFFPTIIYLASSNVLYTIDSPITTNFATYNPISVQIPSEAQEFSIASDFSNVVNFDQISLSSEQKDRLRNTGFLVIPSQDYGEMYEIYPSIHTRNNSVPNFITSDVIVHMFHTLVQSIVKQTESMYFQQDLLDMTRQLLTSSYQDYLAASEPWKSAAKSNTAIFGVAVSLLDENASVPLEVQSLVFQEVDLIKNSQNLTMSPILDRREDYSHYFPTGHYQDTTSLTRYYQATTWLGRILFRLQSQDQTVSLQQIKNETRQALLITRSCQNNPSLFDSWQKIFDVSAFLGGSTEDLTLYDYSRLSFQIFGRNPTLSQIENNLDNFIAAAVEQAFVQKNTFTESEELGYRFLHLRSLPDSIILQQVSTLSRSMPSALDIMAVLGSSRAYQHLITDQMDTEYQNNFLFLNQTFTGFNASDWTNSFYWLWLYTLMPLLSEKGESFLPFMRQAGWKDKDLIAALGSWTELRQEAPLYA
ncbi:MAG: DUF3160 domain-containing protein, partial [Candidatus Hodarchaeota archaeon]